MRYCQLRLKRISESLLDEIEGIGEVRVYTVEDVLDKEMVAKNRINRIEDLY